MYQTHEPTQTFRPLLFSKNSSGIEIYNSILTDHPDAVILDFFASQKKELFKIQNPKQRLSTADLDGLYTDWLINNDPQSEGIWAYYQWSNRLIHILDKKEFVQLRTSRNQYKIFPEEQTQLLNKVIGIIGLSVGHAVALSIATERICGKLKLADFDTIELSNLNRIKTGIHNIGLNKCIVTAREIAEIDPFIEIECYLDGINEENLEDFLTKNGKLDILIDECDDLEIKIACREMAKKMHIPVVMETSDRGMLDVERFDLSPDIPIFHGLLNGIPSEKLKNISPQDRIPLVLKIVDAMKSSRRGRVSLLEVGQTISTWPQLASAVTLGGGVVTDASRRILLDQFTDSGRYYVDLEDIIANKEITVPKSEVTHLHGSFNIQHAIELADSIPHKNTEVIPSNDDIKSIVDAGSRAPSTGNDQPWKWLFRNGHLYLFHDISRSRSFANYNNTASDLALGAAYENVMLASRKLGYHASGQLLPLGKASELLASISFSDLKKTEQELVLDSELADWIYTRTTNRNIGFPVTLPDTHYTSLRIAAEEIPDAQLHFITDKSHILELGKIVGESDLMMMLNKQGHHDFFGRNVKWTPDDINNSNDGISIQALGYAPAQLITLSMIRDQKIATALRTIGGGNSWVENTQHAIGTASTIAYLTLPKANENNFFLGGMSMQRLWLKAEQLGLAIQPLLSPIFLFERLSSGSGLEADEIMKLDQLRKRFRSITNLEENLTEIFLLKISNADKNTVLPKRLPLSEILFISNNEI